MIILFFLFILVIFTILIIAIHTSKIGIDIKNLIIDTDAEEKINEDGKIYVYLLLFNKIKLFRKNVRNIPMKDVKFETSDFDIKIFKNKDIKINYLELIQNINIDIKNIDLNVNIGTEDAGITAILVGILAGILGIIIKKPKYQILPIYANRNLLKINLNGIFTIYLMHYIYKFIKNNIKERFMDKALNKNLNFKVR
ncbi:MAG: DUF2953 domain-containing protein [Clostridia bacterium]|nr:DUF2953 domain-containing protein [Clostridia bacterium]